MAIGGKRKQTGSAPPMKTDVQRARARLKRREQQNERDMEILFNKPISQWELKELLQGYPEGVDPNGGDVLDEDGNVVKRARKFVLPATGAAEIERRLRSLVYKDLGSYLPDAIQFLGEIIRTDDVDLDGKPVVPPSVRVDAAKYLIDHMIGKSTTKVDVKGEVDLRSILAPALVNPDGARAYSPVSLTDDVSEDGEEELDR